MRPVSVETSPLERPDAPGGGAGTATAEGREADLERGLERPQWMPAWIDVLAIIGVIAVGVVTRFVARSALWLDEALTVNIAKLPVSQIGPWLRHDGHPPLYYWMLHYWMKVFGSGDTAVRALSGVIGLILLPLVWLVGNRVAGRKGAWTALLLTAVSPFAVRYSTEARMYSLVMVLVACGWLLLPDTLREPRWWRLAGITVITALLLWSHYWAMYLVAAVAIVLLVGLLRDRRAGDRAAMLNAAKTLGAMAVGCLLFVPWLPSLLYQSAHTGTPWSKPFAPTSVLAITINDFGGGVGQNRGFNFLLGWLTLFAVLLGVFGRGVDRRHIDVDLHTRPRARMPALVIVLTLVLASLVMYATSSGFATRYNAVWFPLFIALAAIGIAQFVGPIVFRGVLAVLLLLGMVGSAATALTHTRTQARVAAQAVIAHGHPGDVVVTCPDQLGPSLSRELPAGRFVVGTYPFFKPPEKVDWVNYKQRLATASPDRFAQEVLRKAGNRSIFLAWSSSYTTHKKSCGQLKDALVRARPGGVELVADDNAFYEHEALDFFPVQPGTAGTASSSSSSSSTP